MKFSVSPVPGVQSSVFVCRNTDSLSAAGLSVEDLQDQVAKLQPFLGNW